MHKFEKYDGHVLIVLFLVVHFLLLTYFGIRNLFDAVVYESEADLLFQFGRLAEADHIFYFVPIVLIGFFKWMFHGQIMPYLIFQMTISCLAMLSLYASTSRIFNSKLAGLISGLIFLMWWDNIHWNTTTMTESLSCSVTCFIIYSLTFFRNTFKEYGIVTILLLVVFFIRPTGIVIILGTVVFFISYHWAALKAKPILKFFCIACIFVVGLLGASMMFSRWDFTDQLKRGNIVTYMDTIEGTTLYQESMRMKMKDLELTNSDKHPLVKTVLFVVHNPIHFLKAAGLKIWYLMSFYRPYYSTTHNLLAMSWTFFIYALFLFGFRNTPHPIKVFAMTVIIVNCALIGIATVDWDNRFFIPMEPGIVLLAGGGGALLYKRLISFLVKLKLVRS